MLDFIWGGLGPNRHQPVRPINNCPPSYLSPPPIPYNPSLNYYHNFPPTSCYLSPERGSIAHNFFNGNLFSPPQTYDIFLSQEAIALNQKKSSSLQPTRFYV